MSAVRFVRACVVEGDPGPQPLRYASINGRQFFAMVSAWPELGLVDRMTGIYHAAGREKVQVKGIAREIVVQQGFDVLRPASMVFEYVAFGPLAQLAITLGCKGPFWSIEADELAGAAAAVQALEDLEDGRCDQAIVAGYTLAPPAARAILLEAGDVPTFSWAVRYTFGRTEPDDADLAALTEAIGGPFTFVSGSDGAADPVGLGKVAAAIESACGGKAAATWCCGPDGRGMLLGFGAPGEQNVSLRGTNRTVSIQSNLSTQSDLSAE